MKKNDSIARLAVGIGTVALALFAATAGSKGIPTPGAPTCNAVVPAEAQTRRQPCCFTNPAYSGVCVVEPNRTESCASILAYLNNPQSQGKSYCENTNIRGGWRQVRCEPAVLFSRWTPQAAAPG